MTSRYLQNTTEMEAVLHVFLYVLEAIKELNVTVSVQPSIEGHSVFTDFLFRLYDDQKPLCFIEMKRASDYTNITLETSSVAQALREAHMLLSSETGRTQEDVDDCGV